MTYEAYKYHLKGMTVYSNYHLNFPHIKLTKAVFDELLSDPVGLQDAVLCLDEIHIWIDSRSSMGKKNKIMTYFLLQTRKRNVRLLCTTQHLHQVDRRLRDTIDILVFCRNMTNKTSTVQDSSKDVYILQEYVFQWKDDARPRLKKLYANPIFSLFDTTEIVSFQE